MTFFRRMSHTFCEEAWLCHDLSFDSSELPTDCIGVNETWDPLVLSLIVFLLDFGCSVIGFHVSVACMELNGFQLPLVERQFRWFILSACPLDNQWNRFDWRRRIWLLMSDKNGHIRDLMSAILYPTFQYPHYSEFDVVWRELPGLKDRRQHYSFQSAAHDCQDCRVSCLYVLISSTKQSVSHTARRSHGFFLVLVRLLRSVLNTNLVSNHSLWWRHQLNCEDQSVEDIRKVLEISKGVKKHQSAAENSKNKSTISGFSAQNIRDFYLVRELKYTGWVNKSNPQKLFKISCPMLSLS